MEIGSKFASLRVTSMCERREVFNDEFFGFIGFRVEKSIGDILIVEKIEYILVHSSVVSENLDLISKF